MEPNWIGPICVGGQGKLRLERPSRLRGICGEPHWLRKGCGMRLRGFVRGPDYSAEVYASGVPRRGRYGKKPLQVGSLRGHPDGGGSPQPEGVWTLKTRGADRLGESASAHLICYPADSQSIRSATRFVRRRSGYKSFGGIVPVNNFGDPFCMPLRPNLNLAQRRLRGRWRAIVLTPRLTRKPPSVWGSTRRWH
jgi:hypothetical protein